MSRDYYQILGISRRSNSDEIKRAYKMLALKYHPDKNPDDQEAEECFKEINEAYQVLSDPIKRSKYNHHLEYDEVMRARNQPSQTEYNPTYSRPAQPKPQRKTSAYKIDKEYYRVQKILIGIFLALIGSAYGLGVLKEYRIKWAEEDRIEANELLLDSALSEFRDRHFERAFSMVDRLIENNITDFDYYIHRDSMMSEIRQSAMTSFQAQNYERAAQMFKVVRKFEWRERSTTLEFLSTSYARAGNGSEAIRLLREKLKEEPTNISLLYYTAYLHFQELNKSESALTFLNSAKKLFKDNNTKMYGNAFEFIIRPENIPEVYYKVYNLSGRINYSLANYGEAYTDSNWAIFIRPDNREPYHRRIDSGILSSQTGRICRDISTLISLGEEVGPALINKYCKN